MLTKLYTWLAANAIVFKGNYGQRQHGASMIEYVLIVAVIAIVAIAFAATLGDDIGQIFTDASTCITSGTC